MTENYVAATCTEDGSYDSVVYCADCGDELSRIHNSIEALGHDIVHNKGKDKTCTQDGWAPYDTCTQCDYSTYKKLPKGHTPADTAVEVGRIDPTCESQGFCYSVIYCTDCGRELDSVPETIDPLGHDIASYPAKEPSCTECGWEAYEVCARCLYSTYSEIPASGHDYEHARVERTCVDSTCSVAGYEDVTWYCPTCNQMLSHVHNDFPLVGHTANDAVKENCVEATCTVDGHYDSVTYCKFCTEELSRVTVPIPSSHTPAKQSVKENIVEPTYGYNGTGTDGGYDEVTYCSICTQELRRDHTITRITAREYYLQYDYLELSADVNAIDNLVDNGDGTYTLTAKTSGGKTVRLLIVGEIGELAGGWGVIGKDTKIYTLDALPGVNYVDCDFIAHTGEFGIRGYYNLDQKASVDSIDDLYDGNVNALVGRGMRTELYRYPNFICLNDKFASSQGTSVKAVSIKIYYCNVMSEITDVKLNEYLYSKAYSQASYVAGDLYDAAIEKTGVEFGYPLQLLFDNPECLAGKNDYYSDLITVNESVKFGNIVDESGKVVDKTGRYLKKGDKIEVTIGNCTRYLKLCNDTFTGESLYDTSSVCYIKSTGTQNVLVIPVTFTEQQNRINDEWMSALRGALGNVVGADGKVTKYTLTNGEPSLSEFLYTSSYGKLTVNSFITDPYVIDGDPMDYYNNIMPDSVFNDITEWLYGLEIDNSAFDQNGDGYYDVVILVNTLMITDPPSEYYVRMGMSGIFMNSRCTDTRDAGTHEKPSINTYLNVSSVGLFSSKGVIDEKYTKTDSFIHEFGHTLGLTDYYANEAYFSSTIGKFDMESDSTGDWNSYTKYLLGWIEPKPVDGTKDEVEITISTFATHGDAILIRALGYDGNGTPYDEYIMIDLFAHDGLYAKDSADYGLSDTVGVRIYHVNSVYDTTYVEWEGKKTFTSWSHYGVDEFGRRSDDGIYLLELVQKGNVSTFMNKDGVKTTVDADDYFYEGETFSVDGYDGFFYNGKMDNGMDFGYTVTVKKIVENGADSTATIVITKKAK